MNKNPGMILWLSNYMCEGNLCFGKESRDLLCLYLNSAHEKWKIKREAGRKLHGYKILENKEINRE